MVRARACRIPKALLRWPQRRASSQSERLRRHPEASTEELSGVLVELDLDDVPTRIGQLPTYLAAQCSPSVGLRLREPFPALRTQSLNDPVEAFPVLEYDPNVPSPRPGTSAPRSGPKDRHKLGPSVNMSP